MSAGAWIRIGAAVVLGVAAVATWQSGVLADLSLEGIGARVRALGAWGPLGYLVLFCLAELISIPSVLFVVAASLIWPTPVALPLAWLGAVAAATTVFSVARWFASDALRTWILARTPKGLRRLDERLLEHGVRNVALIRLATFMVPLVHWLLGFSRVRLRDATLGTALGVLPGVSLLVLLGDAAVRSWETARPWVLGAVGVLIAARVAQRVYAARRDPAASGSS